MKKTNNSKYLLKLNLLFTFLTVLFCTIVFHFTGFNTSNFIEINSYENGILFFIYLLVLFNIKKDKYKDIQQEALLTNYALNIGIFILLIILIFIFSCGFLYKLNPDALNITFISTLFINIITMLFSSILMLVFIYLIVPQFIIPKIEKFTSLKYSKIVKIIFILFVIFCSFNLLKTLLDDKTEDLNNPTTSKMTVKYQTSFLDLNEISPYSKKLLSKKEIKIRFYYTTTEKKNISFEQAQSYCNSINGQLPSYLEIYHIIFNKFDTIGDNYYWTNDKDGRYNLVLHFKNMSYKIVRKPNDIIPITYCVQKTEKDNIDKSVDFSSNETITQTHSYKIESKDIEQNHSYNNYSEKISQENYQEYYQKDYQENYQANLSYEDEKKYVNFSVKEVTPEILNELKNQGYNYDEKVSIRRDYETNDKILLRKIKRNSNEIKLCDYPFTEYQNFNIGEEADIWAQSFCSPSFVVIKQTPKLTNKREKDIYCNQLGGRLPNIPELNGLIKTLGIYNRNTKFWINNIINGKDEVIVEYKDSRFIEVKKAKNVENDLAYTFCITNSKKPSKIIANYKPKFYTIKGEYFAKKICPDCYYYEVPDVILQQ